MLTLAESEGRKHAKRPRGQKKRVKTDKSQKRVLFVPDKEIELENKEEIIAEEELKIHELMPVPYKPDDNDPNQVTFETTTDDQDCQSVVATLQNMEGVANSNKYVIITLLEPDQLAGQHILNAEEVIEEVDDKTRQTHQKIQKKVILLHKFDPSQVTQTIQTTAIPQTETITHIVKEKEGDDQDSLMTINFGELETSPTDNKEQRDISNWVKKFNSLTLLYTESGKPYIKCPACTAMFFKHSSFEKHISCHLKKQDELYICTYCRYSTDDASAMFTHLFMHQDQCEVCNMNLTRKNSFKKHWDLTEMSMSFSIKRDRWGRFVCIYCKLGFDLSHQLQKHWFKHSCNSKKTFQCDQCSGLFDTSEALDNHVCLKCPVCGKICDSVHRLRSHTRYEKHYLYCNTCSYEFILAIDHEKHMELHKKIYHSHKDYSHCLESEDGSSFQCELCGKIYHTMSCLVLHIHDDHKISSEDNGALVGEEVDDEITRITLTEDKDGTTSYDIIHTLKGELKCEVELQRTCEQVLEVQTDGTFEEADDENNEHKDCEPVALCWNRYSIEEEEEDETTIKAT